MYKRQGESLAGERGERRARVGKGVDAHAERRYGEAAGEDVYKRQNPPIDPIREEMVMSLISYIGTERNILAETPQHCHTLRLPHPILTNRDLERLRRVSQGSFLATTLPMLFAVEEGERGLERALGQLCRRASLAIQSGYTLLILSDRGLDRDLSLIHIFPLE